MKPNGLMKRFYKDVTVKAFEDSWCILLDTHTAKTPGGRTLAVPTKTLAMNIAHEWDRQDAFVNPDSMPLSCLANTCLETLLTQRQAMEAVTKSYLDADLLCYPADSPDSLVALQNKLWTPERKWVKARYDSALNIAPGIMPVAQDPSVVARLGRLVEDMDDWQFTAAQLLVSTTGSYVLMLGAMDRRLDAEAVIARAFLPERHHMDIWGHDTDQENALAIRAANVHTAINWLHALWA